MTTDSAEAAEGTAGPPRVDAHHLWDLPVRDQPWTREPPILRRDTAIRWYGLAVGSGAAA